MLMIRHLKDMLTQKENSVTICPLYYLMLMESQLKDL